MDTMKFFTSAFVLFYSLITYSQQTEDLIPTKAISVFSINSGSLLQKISLDDLVKYDFMEGVQQELFDGSTSGKTIKESGIDFDQKLNVFFGKGEQYEVSGFTFGISDEDELFEVFDDFEQQESAYEGTEQYNSYMSHLVVTDKKGVLIRVMPNYRSVSKMADSIWMSQGNKRSYYNDWYYDDYTEIIEETEAVEFTEEMETEEDTSSPSEKAQFPVADEDPTKKTYYELRDSVRMVLNASFLKEVLDDLLISKNNLKKTSSKFAQQLTSDAQGIFYFDNSRFNQMGNYHHYRPFYSSFYNYVDELYENNTVVGEIMLNDGLIELNIDANYNNKLGSIYTELSNSKFDKNVLNYIHKDNQAFFTYNVNLREAYEQTYKTLVPLLEKSKNSRAQQSLLMLDLFDEFANKDAIFNTYKGSMFGSFNGIKKVKTTKIIYHYDEESFEGTETEVESEEDMPIFTLGFSSKNNAFSDKFLRRIMVLSHKEVHKEGDLWIIDRGALNAAPLYFILKNDLFIVSNDENLALNHIDGYGSESLSKDFAKKAKKSKFLYGHADFGKAIDDLPPSIFSKKENEMIDALKGKTGQVELTSSSIDQEKASFQFSYSYNEQNEDVATYVLDIINSLYTHSK